MIKKLSFVGSLNKLGGSASEIKPCVGGEEATFAANYLDKSHIVWRLFGRFDDSFYSLHTCEFQPNTINNPFRNKLKSRSILRNVLSV